MHRFCKKTSTSTKREILFFVVKEKEHRVNQDVESILDFMELQIRSSKSLA